MTVRKEMINGFGIVHGGVAFSLADSAFAFACNNRNNLSVALDTSINFLKPVHVDDRLTAEDRRPARITEDLQGYIIFPLSIE